MTIDVDTPPYVVPEAVKRKRRWVNDYLETLDPDTEYDRIMAVQAMYQQDEHALHMFITSSAVHVLMPAHGAEAVLYTNHYIRRPNRRNQNTLAFFWQWFSHGPNHPDSVEATKQLNHIHGRVAKHLPGHFDLDSDYIYTLALFTVIQNRLRKKLGLAEVPDYIKKATYNFFRDVCTNMRKGDGSEIEGYPDSFEGCEAYVEDWERWEHRMSVPQRDLILAFMDQYVAKNFPGPLEFIGRSVMLYTIPDHILEHYRIEPLRGLQRRFAHTLLKTLFLYKDRFAADAKTPFIERRQALSKEELEKLDAKSKARADKAGWTRGGREALYVTEGGHSISACPVMHGRGILEPTIPEDVLAEQPKVTENGRVEYGEYENNDEFAPQ